jgi:hypothetical protein
MKHTTQGSSARGRFFMHILQACRNEFGAPEMCFSLQSVCSPSRLFLCCSKALFFINTNSKSVSFTALHRARFNKTPAGFLVQANLIAGCVFARRQTAAPALCEWHFVISRMHI